MSPNRTTPFISCSAYLQSKTTDDVIGHTLTFGTHAGRWRKWAKRGPVPRPDSIRQWPVKDAAIKYRISSDKMFLLFPSPFCPHDFAWNFDKLLIRCRPTTSPAIFRPQKNQKKIRPYFPKLIVEFDGFGERWRENESDGSERRNPIKSICEDVRRRGEKKQPDHKIGRCQSVVGVYHRRPCVRSVVARSRSTEKPAKRCLTS